MRQLDTKTRALILCLLVEGKSLRDVAKIAVVSKNTVNKLLIDAGKACAKYHDEHVKNIRASSINCDTIWSFTPAKQTDIQISEHNNLNHAKESHDFTGDIWTRVAIDRDSKLIISYLVGRRDKEYATAFMDDLRSRISNSVEFVIEVAD